MIISASWITNCSRISALMSINCKKLDRKRNALKCAWWDPSKSNWCGYANFFRYEKSSLPRGRYRWKFKILDVYAERLQKMFILFWHQWLGMGALIFQLSVCIKIISMYQTSRCRYFYSQDKDGWEIKRILKGSLLKNQIHIHRFIFRSWFLKIYLYLK